MEEFWVVCVFCMQKMELSCWWENGDGNSTLKGVCINPLTPMGDQDRIPPYNINTRSTR